MKKTDDLPDTPPTHKDSRKLVRLRLNEEEHAAFMKKVNASGLSQSAYMRKLLNGKEVFARPCEHHAELLSTLTNISNDVGELVRHSHQRGLSERDISELRKLISDTWLIVSQRY